MSDVTMVDPATTTANKKKNKKKKKTTGMVETSRQSAANANDGQSSGTNALVAQVKETLPHLSLDEIYLLLHGCDYDVERAIETHLTESIDNTTNENANDWISVDDNPSSSENNSNIAKTIASTPTKATPTKPTKLTQGTHAPKNHQNKAAPSPNPRNAGTEQSAHSSNENSSAPKNQAREGRYPKIKATEKATRGATNPTHQPQATKPAVSNGSSGLKVLDAAQMIALAQLNAIQGTTLPSPQPMTTAISTSYTQSATDPQSQAMQRSIQQLHQTSQQKWSKAEQDVTMLFARLQASLTSRAETLKAEIARGRMQESMLLTRREESLREVLEKKRAGIAGAQESMQRLEQSLSIDLKEWHRDRFQSEIADVNKVLSSLGTVTTAQEPSADEIDKRLQQQTQKQKATAPIKRQQQTKQKPPSSPKKKINNTNSNRNHSVMSNKDGHSKPKQTETPKRGNEADTPPSRSSGSAIAVSGMTGATTIRSVGGGISSPNGTRRNSNNNGDRTPRNNSSTKRRSTAPRSKQREDERKLKDKALVKNNNKISPDRPVIKMKEITGAKEELERTS